MSILLSLNLPLLLQDRVLLMQQWAFLCHYAQPKNKCINQIKKNTFFPGGKLRSLMRKINKKLKNRWLSSDFIPQSSEWLRWYAARGDPPELTVGGTTRLRRPAQKAEPLPPLPHCLVLGPGWSCWALGLSLLWKLGI